MDLLDLDLVKARLQERAPELRAIGFAAELNDALQPGGVIASPSAFILQAGEEGFAVREGSGPLRQEISVTVSVLLATRTTANRAEAGLKALKAPIKKTRFGLFGWAHPEATRKFHLAGGGIEDFNLATGVLLYRLDFEAPVVIQEELP